MYLYLLRNTVNGKGYVGITSHPVHRRIKRHFSNARTNEQYYTHSTALVRALKKYGEEAFTMTLLAEANSWEELQVLERIAIQEHNTYAHTGHGYNLTLGGDGGYGLKVSDAVRQQKSEKSRQYWSEHPHPSKGKTMAPRGPRPEALRQHLAEKSREYLALHGNPMQGRKHSEETRRKIAAKATGRIVSEETRAKLAKALQGRPSPMHGKKGGKAWNKGIPATEEHRKNLVASHVGKKHPKSRPIELDGQRYEQIIDAVRSTGYSKMQVKYRLQTGRARYLDTEEKD